MKYFLVLFTLLVIGLSFLAPIQHVYAESTAGSPVVIPNPIACKDITCLLSQVIRYILGTISIVATLMFIYGGFMMLTSGGNADRIKKAKETLAWASIGIVVILLSWAIIRFLLVGITGQNV